MPRFDEMNFLDELDLEGRKQLVDGLKENNHLHIAVGAEAIIGAITHEVPTLSPETDIAWCRYDATPDRQNEGLAGPQVQAAARIAATAKLEVGKLLAEGVDPRFIALDPDGIVSTAVADQVADHSYQEIGAVLDDEELRQNPESVWGIMRRTDAPEHLKTPFVVAAGYMVRTFALDPAHWDQTIMDTTPRRFTNPAYKNFPRLDR